MRKEREERRREEEGRGREGRRRGGKNGEGGRNLDRRVTMKVVKKCKEDKKDYTLQIYYY